MVPRWWRNRMGKPLFSHRFIKRSLEFWATSTKQLLNAGGGHRAPEKAAHSLWKEVGQNIKDKMREKRVMTVTHSRKVVVKEEKFPNSRKFSYRWVCGEFWNLRGQRNWEKNKNKNKNTEYAPNWNCQRRSSLDAHVCLQWAGSGQGVTGCMPKVRTRPESPEDNLRGLTWDSNTNCGIARERGKKR